jgi:hypothetical protein
MKTPEQAKGTRTRLSGDEHKRCLLAARTFLKTHDCIRNRNLREITGISYDQAIAFFNQTIADKHLERVGLAGNTRYIKPK